MLPKSDKYNPTESHPHAVPASSAFPEPWWRSIGYNSVPPVEQGKSVSPPLTLRCSNGGSDSNGGRSQSDNGEFEEDDEESHGRSPNAASPRSGEAHGREFHSQQADPNVPTMHDDRVTKSPHLELVANSIPCASNPCQDPYCAGIMAAYGHPSMNDGLEACSRHDFVRGLPTGRQPRSCFIGKMGMGMGTRMADGFGWSNKNNKKKRLMVGSELASQHEDSFQDVKTMVIHYFTYKAAKTVLEQLNEMDPTRYMWFYSFMSKNNPGDGKRFLKLLVKEKQDLAERVMITRISLYAKWMKECDHTEMYKEITAENLVLMRERLMETVIWPADDANTEKIG